MTAPPLKKTPKDVGSIAEAKRREKKAYQPLPFKNGHAEEVRGPMNRRDAEEIQAIVNAAIDEAQGLPDDERCEMGAIIWGDLECTDVEERRSLIDPERQPLITVIIEEADPGAEGLRKFIDERLDAAGWTNVYVETEW